MSLPSSFQEQIALKATGRFRYTARAEEIGLDADALARVARDGRLCVLDFEATGLDADSDALIEVGAVCVRPGSDELEIFNTFIHASHTLSPFIKRLTGIRQEDVDSAPPPHEVAIELDAFIGDAPVVAHNARFEQSWLIRSIGPRACSWARPRCRLGSGTCRWAVCSWSARR